MTPSQLDHLRAIDAHLANLLDIAAKRTPGRWEDDGTGSLWTPWDKHQREASAEGYEGEHITLGKFEPEDMLYIAACAGNAEAGWEVARSTIEQIISMRKDTTCWDFVGKPLMKSILAQWPLELLATAKV
jgi:hypothetical protein